MITLQYVGMSNSKSRIKLYLYNEKKVTFKEKFAQQLLYIKSFFVVFSALAPLGRHITKFELNIVSTKCSTETGYVYNAN